MSGVSLGLSTMLTILGAIKAQFLEQPDPGTVFAPLQAPITLTCSVEEGYIVDWYVVFPNGDSGEASDGIARRVILQKNFTLEGVATNRSTLSLWETRNQTNNGTNITCTAQVEVGAISSTAGNTVQVIFYSAPPPPVDLTVIENELGTLSISWSLRFIEGVPVNYTLLVLNLNTTSAQPIIIAGLLDQHYVFETSRPCDVYSFTVTAVTAAGNSTPTSEVSSEVCLNTTSEYESPETIQQTSSTPVTSNLLPQDNFLVTIVSAVVVTAAALLIILVIVNLVVCTWFCKKTKTVDLSDPVYEIPKDILTSSSAKSSEAPYIMTTSSAYGVSMNPPAKSPLSHYVFPTTSSLNKLSSPNTGGIIKSSSLAIELEESTP